MIYGGGKGPTGPDSLRGHSDSGGASRFFNTFRYQAKAPKSERPVVNGVAHPTVKPLALMEWLVTLFTPPYGVVLDPFTGSGTTGHAALRLGFNSIIIERDAKYWPLIDKRFGDYLASLSTKMG
jgi:site-specific DNA-methyltransferase (adenine-specific)